MSGINIHRDSPNLKAFRPSLLAICTALALAPAAQAADSDLPEDTVIVKAQAGDPLKGQAEDYNVKTTTTGTKLLLVSRDIPQSVSVISQQRIEDQQLDTIGEVLNNVTGVTAQVQDNSRVIYFSRGYFISNYAYDDLPTQISDVWDFGDTGMDTAVYENIEVVRGAAGLMSGTGNPSAYINMVRKHADSREFKANVSATYGSWDKQRYVADLSAPLTENGNVRGRVIAGYQDNDTWMDKYHYKKKFIYGVVDADLTESTVLSLGYGYQSSDERSHTWGGLPTWYADGSRTHFSRSTTTAPDWSYSNKNTYNIFANLVQRFDNGWEARVNLLHTQSKFDTKAMYMMGFPDKVTGAGMYAYGGWNKGERKQDSIDAFLRGGFDLFDRQHELVVGTNLSRQNNRYDNALPDTGLPWGGIPMPSIYQGLADPNWTAFSFYSKDTVRQQAVYTAARFSLADPLHLIAGLRYSEWKSDYNPQATPQIRLSSKQHNVTPYAGLIYDIDDTWSAYTSYTSIFQPTDKRDIKGNYLDPATGKSYEAGVKADWFNTRLTTSFAIFRIEQNNAAEAISNTEVNGNPGEAAYKAVNGTVSKGAEFELNGALTDNWQLTFGASRFVATDKDNKAYNSDQPRTTAKLFTRYNLPMLPEVTVGGGVNWQNKTWNDTTGPQGATRIKQGSYAVVDLFTRYQMTKNFAVQANVNNLFDKEYDSWLSDYVVYGAPRSVSVTASYDF
jgi:outer membrane receptor for ferric coprogen and ferric-rhodotorulic acid